jgi:hypothetical protein
MVVIRGNSIIMLEALDRIWRSFFSLSVLEMLGSGYLSPLSMILLLSDRSVRSNRRLPEDQEVLEPIHMLHALHNDSLYLALDIHIDRHRRN